MGRHNKRFANLKKYRDIQSQKRLLRLQQESFLQGNDIPDTTSSPKASSSLSRPKLPPKDPVPMATCLLCSKDFLDGKKSKTSCTTRLKNNQEVESILLKVMNLSIGNLEGKYSALISERIKFCNACSALTGEMLESINQIEMLKSKIGMLQNNLKDNVKKSTCLLLKHSNDPVVLQLYEEMRKSFCETIEAKSVSSINILEDKALPVKRPLLKKRKKTKISRPGWEIPNKVRKMEEIRISTSFNKSVSLLSLKPKTIKVETIAMPEIPTNRIPTSKGGPWVSKLATENFTSKEFPCGICKEVLKSVKEARLHRKFIHPNFVLCGGPLNLSCRKIFRASEIKLHRKEAHSLLPCTQINCPEFFTSESRRSNHIVGKHPNLPLPQEILVESTVKALTEIDMQSVVTPRVVLQRVGGTINFGSEVWTNEVCVKVEHEDEEEIIDEFEFGPYVKEEDNNFLDSEATKEKESENNILVDGLQSIESDSSNFNNASNLCETVTKLKEIGSSNEISNLSCPKPTNDDLKNISNKEDNIIKLTPTPVLSVKTNEQKAKVIPVKIPITVSYTCSVCQSRFSLREELINHFKETHSRKIKFACYVCNLLFDSQEACETHVSKKHPKTVIRKVYQHFRPQEKKKETFKCETCYKVLNTQEDALKHRLKHVKKVNLPGKGKHFQCPVNNCVKIYTSDIGLEMHSIKVHNMERAIYKCPVKKCYRKFKFKSTFKKHSRLCTPEHPMIHIRWQSKKVLCNICGKFLRGSSKLNVHKAIHFDERPFLCQTCGKTFKTKNNLYIHGWSHDPDRKQKYSLYFPKAVREKIKQDKLAAAAEKQKQSQNASISLTNSTAKKRITPKKPIEQIT